MKRIAGDVSTRKSKGTRNNESEKEELCRNDAPVLFY